MGCGTPAQVWPVTGKRVHHLGFTKDILIMDVFWVRTKEKGCYVYEYNELFRTVSPLTTRIHYIIKEEKYVSSSNKKAGG